MRVHALPAGYEGVAPRDYTMAMGLHVSSVCVVTTRIGPQRFGLTATAVSSVCAVPPRLLICVNKSGATHERIQEAGRFCVNVLSEYQDAVAKTFAGMAGADTDRFACAEWTSLKTGSPVLVDAAASFDCEIGQVVEQFTHTVFFGDVVGVASRAGADSLLYGSRKFRQLRKVISSLDANGGETLHF